MKRSKPHKSVLHGLIRLVDHVVDMRRPLFGLLFETCARDPPWKMHICPIVYTEEKIIASVISDLQKGSMSNVQPVMDADSTAWSAFSAKETYGSSCGAMSIPYAMPIITCPDMLQGDVNR